MGWIFFSSFISTVCADVIAKHPYTHLRGSIGVQRTLLCVSCGACGEVPPSITVSLPVAPLGLLPLCSHIAVLQAWILGS